MPVWLGRDGPGIGDEDYRELALRLVIECGRRGNSKDLVDCWLAMSPVASLDGHVVDIVGLQRELCVMAHGHSVGSRDVTASAGRRTNGGVRRTHSRGGDTETRLHCRTSPNPT
eukprot:7379080-Prymnesium_polylepis.2